MQHVIYCKIKIVKLMKHSVIRTAYTVGFKNFAAIGVIAKYAATYKQTNKQSGIKRWHLRL